MEDRTTNGDITAFAALRESQAASPIERRNFQCSNDLQKTSLGIIAGTSVGFENFYATGTFLLKIILGEWFARQRRASGMAGTSVGFENFYATGDDSLKMILGEWFARQRRAS